MHRQDETIDSGASRMTRLTALLLACGVVLLALRVVVDMGQPLFADDIWWHVALGRVMLAQRGLPSVEPLLFTSAAHAQFYQEWLFEVVTAVLDARGGTPALRLTQVLLVAAIVQQVYAFARRRGLGRALALLVVAALLLFAYQRFVQLRPELCTMLFFYGALNVYCVPRLAPWRSALLLTLVAVWANMHGTVLLLFPFLAAYLLVGERGVGLRSAAHAWSLLGALVAAALNPQGPRVLWFYFIHDSNNALIRVIDEWGRLFVVPKDGADILPWSSPLLLGAYVLLTLAVIVVALRGLRQSAGEPPRVPVCELLWAAMAVVAAALAVRFLWMAPLALSAVLRGSGATTLAKGRQRVLACMVLAAALWHVLGAGTTGYSYPLKREALKVWSARDAVQGKFLPRAILAIRDSGWRGHLYAPYSISGFASYQLYPRVRLFLNGRYDGYSREVFDDYWRVFDGGRTLLEILRRYGIDSFLLPVADDNYRLIYSLQLLGWCMAYQDDNGQWLRAPAADGTCADHGASVDASIESKMRGGDYLTALRDALRHHRYTLATRIVADPAAAKMVGTIHVSLGHLCRLHGALADELAPALPATPGAGARAAAELCVRVAGLAAPAAVAPGS